MVDGILEEVLKAVEFAVWNGLLRDKAILLLASPMFASTLSRTFTINLSFNRSSIVLPSRFRFLEPKIPSPELRKLSDAGVKGRVLTEVVSASETRCSDWPNIAIDY